jgi:hypothetical protein
VRRAVRLAGLVPAWVLLACALALSACGAATGPAGQPSPSNVNPETGSRGGSGASA